MSFWQRSAPLRALFPADTRHPGGGDPGPLADGRGGSPALTEVVVHAASEAAASGSEHCHGRSPRIYVERRCGFMPGIGARGGKEDPNRSPFLPRPTLPTKGMFWRFQATGSGLENRSLPGPGERWCRPGSGGVTGGGDGVTGDGNGVTGGGNGVTGDGNGVTGDGNGVTGDGVTGGSGGVAGGGGMLVRTLRSCWPTVRTSALDPRRVRFAALFPPAARRIVRDTWQLSPRPSPGACHPGSPGGGRRSEPRPLTPRAPGETDDPNGAH